MFTEKMTKQTQQISDYEYEISLLRKQLEGLETEHEKDKKKIADLEELLKKAREVRTSGLSVRTVRPLGDRPAHAAHRFKTSERQSHGRIGNMPKNSAVLFSNSVRHIKGKR